MVATHVVGSNVSLKAAEFSNYYAPGASERPSPPNRGGVDFRCPTANLTNSMASTDSFQTKSSQVYGELRRDITAGNYKPGQHLVRRDLVKRFGVSLSIVNEALGRLSSDGLVESK